jgi:hypothetical protein
MPSDLTPDQVAAATLAMKSRIARIILEGPEAKSETVLADIRTATLLQRHGVFNRNPKFKIEGVDASDFTKLITDEPLGMGPLLFFRQDSSQSVTVHPAEILVLDCRSSVRIATVKYLKQLGCLHRIISTRTLRVIDDRIDRLASDMESDWQPAAVAISDTIENDFLLTLAGVKQSIFAPLEDAYRKYFTKVIRPSYEALDGFDPPITSASSQGSDIERAIQTIVEEAKDWQEAIRRYWLRYGHVPLAEPLSISRLYREWCSASRAVPSQFYENLWKWAEERQSPLARYHVCFLLISHPKLVPAEEWPQLWIEIAQVIHIPKETSTEYSWTLAWQIRCDLAKYYGHFLESRVPGQSGELVSLCAWSCAEDVASLLPLDDAVLSKIRVENILPNYELSADVWQILLPNIKPHHMRYGTLFVRSMWSLSMLSHLGETLSSLSTVSMGEKEHEFIEFELSGAVLSLFPAYPVLNPAYAFEKSPLQTAESWVALGLASDERLEVFRSIAEKIGHLSDASSPLDMLGKGNDADDVLISHAIRVAAFSGGVPSGKLFEMMQDDKWRHQMLVQGSDNRFEILANALLAVASVEAGRWAIHLPHFFAMACEQSTSNRDRQKGLFSCVVMACVASDTSSALERLVTGRYRSSLLEDVREWRARLEGMQLRASEWGAAKIRAVLAVLHA